MPNNPVQVILNTRDYFVIPEAPGAGPSKDFFEGRDKEFVEHRDRLARQVASIAGTFERSKATSGVLKVNVRREAWAKSHRPQRALFPPSKRPCVAVSKVGELFYHVTLDDVREIEQQIISAETETQRRVSKKSGKEYAAPSEQRSDVGAIETIALPTAADKRHFSVEEAILWLSDPRTSKAYFVELFPPPSLFDRSIASRYYEAILENIGEAAKAANLTIETFSVNVKAAEKERPSGIFGVRLLASETDRNFNESAGNHTRLLSLLESNSYVRRVLLPPIVVAARLRPAAQVSHAETAPPARQGGVKYPKVGVVDGGIGDCLAEWTVGAHNVVAPEHQEKDHGTFIGGLLVAGQELNGAQVCPEDSGCDLYDIRILPDTDQLSAFEYYYPNGVVDFMEELAAGVEAAKRDHGIRIFNMSLNLLDPVQDDSYGIVASMLDQIADKHGCVFVISAGNLDGSNCRQEWSSDPQTTLKHLAARTLNETILQPAESSRSIAVGALNPPGNHGRVEGAPTVYTRKGPGLRVGVKPDVGHFGGAMPDGRSVTGLRAWDGSGAAVSGHGTSYAAPFVAKTLASLESQVTTTLSPEILLAMLIHGCELPKVLDNDLLREVARQFTGFGVPKHSKEMLHTPDHAITLVFSDILHDQRHLQFDFAWPRSLVNQSTGACTGDIQMTLAYRPPLDRNFGGEFVRVNVDAYLRQEDGKTYASRLEQAYLPNDPEEAHFEHELIQHGLKWWPIKVYRASFPHGKGSSSNWRLSIRSIVRSEAVFPMSGVPFALVLTIVDQKETAPVFNDLRLHLQSRNVRLADIRTATSIRVAGGRR